MEEGQCLWCSIVQNKQPSAKIYEDNEFIAVLDIRPANYGHTLVMPKEHFQTIFEMPPNLVEKLFSVCVKISSKIMQAVPNEGFNIVYGAGQAAGQRVPHVMVHIIPRLSADKVVINWDSIEPKQEEFNKIYSALLTAMKTETIIQQPEPKPHLEPEKKPPKEEEGVIRWVDRRIP